MNDTLTMSRLTDSLKRQSKVVKTWRENATTLQHQHNDIYTQLLGKRVMLPCKKYYRPISTTIYWNICTYKIPRYLTILIVMPNIETNQLRHNPFLQIK